MGFSFENQGTKTYLVYTIEENDVVDTMTLGMLTNNTISGLATTQFLQMNNTKCIKYNISAKISVKQFFDGIVNRKRLIGVFKGITNAMLAAEDYMIDESSILLDLDYIFTDVSTCETELICMPVRHTIADSQLDLSAFFKNIMFSTKFDQTENSDHVVKIINYLNSAPVFSLSDFQNVLDSIDGSAHTAPVTAATSVPVSTPAPAPVSPAVVQVPAKPVVAPASVPVVTENREAPPKTKPQESAPANNVPFQIPGKTPEQPQANQNDAKVVDGDGKKMSFMYLLQHYNKENASIYKAQKAEKKNKQANTPKKEKKNATQAPVAGNGFQIPGQPAPSIQAQPAQNTVKPTPVAPAGKPPVQSTPVVVQTPVYQAPSVPSYAAAQGNANFGETTVLGVANVGETTVLGGAPVQNSIRPHLIRQKNNERIELDKPVFKIGKERSYVDYFIGDNTAISRSHANILTREENYYIVDTNSTNHTYVDGVMLQSNAELQLVHGAKIRLANEEFVFNMY